MKADAPTVAGADAERRVADTLRRALPDDYRIYRNVPLVSRSRWGGPAHEAEIDVLVVHPEHGLLVVEVKSGEPRRDEHGRWWIGSNPLPRSPWQQASDARHDLLRILMELPDWPPHSEPRHGHAVAFPDADVHGNLGPDAPTDITLDAATFETPDATRRAMERAIAFWEGDGSRAGPLTAAQLAAIGRLAEPPPVQLRRILRRQVDDDRDVLLQTSRRQAMVLGQHRRMRKLDVVGPAGSGKSMLAAELARRHAGEGARTLLVCFNQPLAAALIEDMADLPTTTRERLHVSTFHTLCETLAERAGLAPPKPPPPAEPQPSYWDKDLPSALAHALDALPEERWHTVVVDEGQDFAPDWLETLQLALSDPSDGVFWVFHDPGQALYHDDQVDQLKLPVVELFEDYRSPRPLAELAAGFYTGPQPPIAMREDGVAPRFVEAATDHDVLEAVRRTLHQLTVEEQVRSWDIVVLSGRSAVHSAVWRQRAFGNLVLWNGAIDDAGRSLRLRADQLPPEPADAAVVRFETVRRFKGLERPVVVLCELPDRPIDDPAKEASWDNLVYTALTRATTQAIVIGSLGRAAPASA